jgi:hypothetical protein
MSFASSKGRARARRFALPCLLFAMLVTVVPPSPPAHSQTHAQTHALMS